MVPAWVANGAIAAGPVPKRPAIAEHRCGPPVPRCRDTCHVIATDRAVRRISNRCQPGARTARLDVTFMQSLPTEVALPVCVVPPRPDTATLPDPPSAWVMSFPMRYFIAVQCRRRLQPHRFTRPGIPPVTADRCLHQKTRRKTSTKDEPARQFSETAARRGRRRSPGRPASGRRRCKHNAPPGSARLITAGHAIRTGLSRIARQLVRLGKVLSARVARQAHRHLINAARRHIASHRSCWSPPDRRAPRDRLPSD